MDNHSGFKYKITTKTFSEKEIKNNWKTFEEELPKENQKIILVSLHKKRVNQKEETIAIFNPKIQSKNITILNFVSSLVMPCDDGTRILSYHPFSLVLNYISSYDYEYFWKPYEDDFFAWREGSNNKKNNNENEMNELKNKLDDALSFAKYYTESLEEDISDHERRLNDIECLLKQKGVV